MKLFITLLIAAVAVSASPLQETEYQTLFTAFVQEHGKTYEDLATMFHRYNVFKGNMDLIIKHQENERRTFDMAMNQFGDMTNQEFTSQYNNYKPEHTAHYGRRYANLSTTNLPSSVDWPSKGVVTPVKNQGQCGSCWSFSTTGAIESATAIHTGTLNSLSEQQLVDCSTSYGNQGCNGGQMQAAFQYVQATGGLESESEYPYTAEDGTCQKPFSTLYDPISGYQNVQQNSELALQAAVAQQPVSVAVDASGSAWQFYSGGVVTSACGTQLDHGVLAAGYGTDGSTEYWLVKNSWGSSWGEEGYIRLKRTTSSSSPGECGIAMDASYPTV